MWGFITVINNTLLPHLRSVFELSYFQTTLIESTWFIGYLLASIPAAKLIERIGYQRALVVGLAVMTFGSPLMVPAARIPSYEVTLIAPFILACGIALLQVAAQPYVAALASAWFIGYLLASIPAAKLIERIGYQRALVVGLAVMTFGSLLMVPAARIPSYEVTLIALFIVACGIALLQVAANPYVAVIGPAETSESRLTLVQAFNTTGDVLAIVFGKYLILNRTTGGTTLGGGDLTYAQRMADAQATQLPYLIVAGVP